MRKNRFRCCLTAALLATVLLTSAGCGARKTQAASSAPAIPAGTTSADSEPSWVQAEAVQPTLTPTQEPTPTPKPKPTSTPKSASAPEPTPAVIRSGTYEGGDGSVLSVAEDGSASYKTKLTGTLNGRPMTAAVTFYGTVNGAGEFSFSKITYLGVDITELAARHGYTDPSPWENVAQRLYQSAR